MRIEGRTIIFDNLIDAQTGETLTRELDPDENVKDVYKRLEGVGRSARKAADRFKEMFQE